MRYRADDRPPRPAEPGWLLQAGRAAEEAACRALLAKGYLPVARNVRWARGEIDLVALDGEVVAFVEVKARRGQGAVGWALEALGPAKQRRLRRLAQGFLQERGWPADTPCRFDLVAVELAWCGRPEVVDLVRDAF